MFITFEAGEGAGKTTQAGLLVSFLRDQGYSVVRTREPGGSPAAESLRDIVVRGEPGKFDALTELLIFTAARRAHLMETVMPALERGDIVVCDRYLGSTLALQGAAGVPDGLIHDLHASFCFNLVPDMTIFINVPTGAALRRGMDRLQAEASSEGRFEAKGAAFHAQVAERFLDLATTDPTWENIRGDQSIEEVHEDIARKVTIALEKRRPRLALRTRRS
jgi:dTMP kinase